MTFTADFVNIFFSTRLFNVILHFPLMFFNYSVVFASLKNTEGFHMFVGVAIFEVFILNLHISKWWILKRLNQECLVV